MLAILKDQGIEPAPERSKRTSWMPEAPRRTSSRLPSKDRLIGPIEFLDITRAARCDEHLGLCVQRVASMAALPDCWDGPGGHHQ
jgi:hypothetical protein